MNRPYAMVRWSDLTDQPPNQRVSLARAHIATGVLRLIRIRQKWKPRSMTSFHGSDKVAKVEAQHGQMVVPVGVSGFVISELINSLFTPFDHNPARVEALLAQVARIFHI